jgi:chloramphenicol 3-O-phosphotransferase
MMELQMPSVILITGIMASGKSTVAQAVAERLPKSVHLRGDVFRRMIVNGRIEMEPDAGEEALEQLRLRYRLAASAAETYCAAGFTVVYQDVIIGPMLAEVVDMLAGWPLYVVVLCPSPDTAAQRDAARHKVAYRGWTPDALDSLLRETTPPIGLWLDTSSQTVEETVESIVGRLTEAVVKR